MDNRFCSQVQPRSVSWHPLFLRMENFPMMYKTLLMIQAVCFGQSFIYMVKGTTQNMWPFHLPRSRGKHELSLGWQVLGWFLSTCCIPILLLKKKLPNNLASYTNIIHYIMHHVGITAAEVYLIWFNLIWFNGAC